MVKFDDVNKAHAGQCERAGLVDAEHIDPGQAFDSGKFAGQYRVLAEADDTGGKRDAGEQH